MLAKCSDQKLKAIAVQELAKPATPATQLEIADAWYDLAQQEKAARQIACLRRSLEWYDRLPNLTGFSKTRVEKRQNEIGHLLPDREKPWRATELIRKQAVLRWQLKFHFDGAADYLRQLDAIGAFLALSDTRGEVVVIRNLRERPAKPKSEDLKSINRLAFGDTDKQFIKSIAEQLKLSSIPNTVVILVPIEIEKELLQQELNYRNRKVEEINTTTFSITTKDGKPIIKVIEQKPK